MSTKLIMESWRKYLIKEQAAAPEAAPTAAPTENPVLNNPVELAKAIKLAVNMAIGQPAQEAQNRASRVSKIGDIQNEISMLRRDYRREFPNQRTHPNITKRLQAILVWIKSPNNLEKIRKTFLSGFVNPGTGQEIPSTPGALQSVEAGEQNL